ncbi:STAS/SEC14 domain-containing protein [Spirillospora sp. NPDC047279]|uniref:STAS/SEC14 domain-containing protein n=1 Tax=Spirillospora sp. NPDC047279 TaxID=3155478 RepID=UPI0033F07951
MPDGVLGVETVGRLTADDYTNVLAPALDAAVKETGKIRILLVFRHEFEGMKPGAAWQDLKLGIRDWNAWERIALVTDHDWMKDGLRLFAWAIPGDVKAFGLAEQDEAAAWAAGTTH